MNDLDLIDRLWRRGSIWAPGNRESETTAALCDEAAQALECMSEALFTILANTEASAIKHSSYEHLAKDIADCAEAALSKAVLHGPKAGEAR